ncbi:MAG: hypothetical protein GY904_20620, partial [Planctomycetaceae bacterium]|nr:hypothetical protein [Planctomycetaceae bacterium]
IPIFVDGKKSTGDPGIHCCDNPRLQMGDCMSGSVVQRYQGKIADGAPLPHVVWIGFGRHDRRGNLYNVEVCNSVQMIGYKRKTRTPTVFESGDNRKWVRVDPKINRLISKLADVDEPAAFNRAYATPGQTQSCRWSDRQTLMPRSYRRAAQLIHHLHLSTTLVSKQFVRYLL